MKRQVALSTLLAAMLWAANAFGITIDFDDFPLPPQSWWNGADQSGGFTRLTAFFHNTFDPAWGFWSGFALSNVNDTNTPGWLNQFAVFSGSGCGGTGIYAVVYDDGWGSAFVRFALPVRVLGLYVNNTTYAALAMRDGDAFCRKFGGVSGNEPDWFRLVVTGRDLEGNVLGSVEHYLADFRFEDPARDYIQSDWRWVDLSALGSAVASLHFELSSSDVGPWGMNTPAYFALDNLTFTYAPPAGQAGTTAISADDLRIVGWATGWRDYQPGPHCDPLWQTPERALGPAEGTSFDIVCLGDGGRITLTFPTPLCDGPGPDFAVFENAFNDDFLELAWVEVSSDGTNFHRFRNHSLTPAPVGAYGAVDTTLVGGLAGKYRQGYGTPFDLAELAGAAGLDLARVRYVRLVDIVGDGSCTDTFGNVIWDPHPTIGSAGFDLDAVAMLNARAELRPILSAGAPTRLELFAFTNWVYEIQAADALGGDWVTLNVITGRNESVVLEAPGPLPPRRFYRTVRRRE